MKEFQLTTYGPLYPEQYKYKYPKAGEDNSVVSVHVYNLESKKTLTMQTGTNTDIYIPRIQWTQNNDILSITRLNRHQNQLEILLADVQNGMSRVLYEEKIHATSNSVRMFNFYPMASIASLPARKAAEIKSTFTNSMARKQFSLRPTRQM